MSFDKRENWVLNNLIITWSEYKEAIEGVNYDKEERIEIDNEEEEWFVKYQNKALALMRKVVGQVHLLPRNRQDYLDLKQDFWIEDGTNIAHREPYNYQRMFRNALAEQIKFMHENEIMVDNGYLNSLSGFGVGSYHQAGQQTYAINKMFRGLHPSAYDYLEQMGWMNMCLNHPMRPEIFYKGEH